MADLSPRDELQNQLAEIERRLRWSDAIGRSLRAAALALAAGTLLSALGKALRLASDHWMLSVAIGMVLASVAVAAAYALSQRRTPTHVARVCDRRLGLKERVSTALETTLAGTTGPLAEALALDARQSLGAVDVRRAFPIRPPVKPTLAVLSLSFVLLMIFLAPGSLADTLSDVRSALPGVGDFARASGFPNASEDQAAASDEDRWNQVDARMRGLAESIARGDADSTEIIDGLHRAELELRPLLTRVSSDERHPARRLSVRLRWLHRAAELDESMRERAYADAVRQLGLLDRRLPSAGEDERWLLAQVLDRGSHQESDLLPDIAASLRRASAAFTSGDRGELAAALSALEAALAAAQAPTDSSAEEDAYGQPSSLQ